MKITIESTFHNTRTTMVPRNGRISGRAWRAALRRLCSSPDCRCGHRVVGEYSYADPQGGVVVTPTYHGDDSQIVEWISDEEAETRRDE